METHIILQRIVLTILYVHFCASTIVPDPCASFLSEKDVAVTMCEDGFATEEIADGNFGVDSVVLRVMKQQDNCKCFVSFIDQTEYLSIFAQPYGGFSNAVPNVANCGVTIDLQLKTNKISPFQCPKDVSRQLAILHNGDVLEVKSRIIQGNFTQGYCLQFYRVYHFNKDFDIQIVCYKNPIREVTTLPAQDLTSHIDFQQTSEFLSTSQSRQTTDSNHLYRDRSEVTINVDGRPSLFAAISGVLSIVLILVLVLNKRERSSNQQRGEESTSHRTYDNLQSDRDTNPSTYSSISTATGDREQYEYLDGI